MYQGALHSYEKALGSDHVASYVPALNTAYNYGLLFEDQGCISDAKRMYSRALRGYEVFFGTDHGEYLDAEARLQNLETIFDSHPVSPTATSLLDKQVADVSSAAGSAGSKPSK
jgi:hypothetical protein